MRSSRRFQWPTYIYQVYQSLASKIPGGCHAWEVCVRFFFNGQVYFADFLNQRLRKLVKINSDWYIYTVAGTGASWCFLSAVWNTLVVSCFAGNLNYIMVKRPHCSTRLERRVSKKALFQNLYFWGTMMKHAYLMVWPTTPFSFSWSKEAEIQA